MLRRYVYGWSFIVAALLFTAATVIAFATSGDPFAPMVVKFGGLALVCVVAQVIYEEAANRT